MLQDVLFKNYDEEYTVKLLQELISIPSETPHGDVVAIIARLEAEMKSLGFDTKVVSKNPSKPNLIAEYNKQGKGPALVLYAHADCAAIEGDAHLWQTNPYGGDIIDGVIYGNGAADAKSGIAQLIAASKAIIDSGLPLDGRLLFIASADGEIGDLEGAKWMYEEGLIPKADFGINADASCLRIQYTFRGRTFWKFTTKGIVCHSNSPQNGVNAVSKMIKVMAAIEQGPFAFTSHPTMPDPTRTWTRVDGGVKHNSLPGRCEAILDLRLIPGMTIAKAGEEMEQILDKLRAEDPRLDVKMELMEFGAREVIAFPSDCRIVEEANKAFQEVTGQAPDNTSGPGSAGCIMYFGELGIPSIFFGPANLETAHQPDECCSIDKLHIATKVTALTVANIIGKQS
ncbi:MAG TPA: M20/M25/M40 family metallo-hydrolase [Anaerovoracaceae bacterium]|nr:M20/M25/M40 family metallo-hydrolase [Anaerovoracaceae bacterium]